MGRWQGAGGCGSASRLSPSPPFLFLVYAHHNWLADFNSPPLWWHTAYGLAFATFSAAMTFTVPAIFLRSARSSLRLLDAMRTSAYGVYLLHFIFLIWLQSLVYDT